MPLARVRDRAGRGHAGAGRARRVGHGLDIHREGRAVAVGDAPLDGEHVPAGVRGREHVDVGERPRTRDEIAARIEQPDRQDVARQRLLVEEEALPGDGIECVEARLQRRRVDEKRVAARRRRIDEHAAGIDGFVHAPPAFEPRLVAGERLLIVRGDLGGTARDRPHARLVDLAAPRIAAAPAADAQRLRRVRDRAGERLARGELAVHVEAHLGTVVRRRDMRPGVRDDGRADVVRRVVVEEEVDAAVGEIGEPVAVVPAAGRALHHHGGPRRQRAIGPDPGFEGQLLRIQGGRVVDRQEPRRPDDAERAVGVGRVDERRPRMRAQGLRAEAEIPDGAFERRAGDERLGIGEVEQAEREIGDGIADAVDGQRVVAGGKRQHCVAVDGVRVGLVEAARRHERAAGARQAPGDRRPVGERVEHQP